MVNSGWSWELHFIDFLCDQLEAEGMFDIFVTNLKV
jgi:hypothetical protein